MNPSAASYTPSLAVLNVLCGGASAASTTAPGSLLSKSQPVSPALLPSGTHPLTAAEKLRLSTKTPLAPKRDPSPQEGVLSLTHPTGRLRYTAEQLLAIRPAAIHTVEHGPIVDDSPFLKIPAAFAPLLHIPHALEFLDVDGATALVEKLPYTNALTAQPPLSSSQDFLPMNGGGYHCLLCAQGREAPCPALGSIVANAKKYILSTKRGVCLMQSANVVQGLLQLALVFESKRSSMRLRLLAEKKPHIAQIIKEYLCGDGYHIPLPPITAHDEWRAMMRALCFDALRDNRTRIVTDLSKHWKKRQTPFEQFVFFFSFRDDRPLGEVKNVLTRSVKPGIAAMLCGDVAAMLVLHNLNFFIPPDYYWSLFPFLAQALGEGTVIYDVVRHLATYLYARQSPHLFNPIESPFASASASSALLKKAPASVAARGQ